MNIHDLLPLELRCESRINPLGIDIHAPRLSWCLRSNSRAQMQAACQILVASTTHLLNEDTGDLWDSGRVASDESAGVEYAGVPLSAHQRCFWKVRIWNQDNVCSPWSDIANWTMGLLHEQGWDAHWITLPANENPADIATVPDDCETSISPWLRKSFTLDSEPDRALIYVNAAGYFELYINGCKVSSDVLSPAVSVLQKRTWVLTYDVRSFLQSGQNTLGLWLGRGWNAESVQGNVDDRPKVRIQGHFESGDTIRTLRSDATWKCRPSPYVTLGPWNWNAFGGERYDARLENPDWCHPRLDDADWSSVEVLPNLNIPATAQICPVNRIGKRIPAIRCTSLAEGYHELDFGTNLSGWLCMKMPQLEKGHLVKFHYADWRYASAAPEDELTPAGIVKSSCSDVLFPDANGGSVRYQVFNQTDEFVAGGGDGETFCGKFNYHGFRFVIVEGLPGNPGPLSATAELIESDLETTGKFACSNQLVNRIHELNLWTVRCLNLGGYIVDCPHRERLGYGDGQVSIQTAVMNWRMDTFYAKWLQDWLDTQNPNGALPFSTPLHPPVAGGETAFGREGPPAWGGTMPVLAWSCALYYGDQTALKKAYAPMALFMERLESHTVDGILRGYGDRWQRLGDWVPPGGGLDEPDNWPSQPANDLFNNCYRLYLWELQAKSADALSYAEEALKIRKRNDSLRLLIHETFYDPQQQCYVNEEQASMVMPLLTGVVPESLRPLLLDKLEYSITQKRNGHLDTGMLGTHFFIQLLSEIGREDLLYAMVNQCSYPSWGYMLSQGATTMWEQWNGYWSRIHSCFTSIAGWFHAGLAGIQPDPAAPGFKKIIIRPAVVGDLEWVRCRHRCNYGTIESNWCRSKDRLEMGIVIPPNITATIYLPTNDLGKVTESGIAMTEIPSIRVLGYAAGRAVVETGSGRYFFSMPHDLIPKANFVRVLENGGSSTLVFYGTSLTAEPWSAWVPMLEGELKKRFPGQAAIHNQATGCMASNYGIENLNDKVLKLNPDVVFIEYAINDAWKGSGISSVDEAKANWEEMINRILQYNRDCEVILMIMNPPVNGMQERVNYEGYCRMVQSLARERGLLLIDHTPAWQDIENNTALKNRYIPDNIHPNAIASREVTLPVILKGLELS
jgi:alpha-L-rhamnosidase